MTASISFYDNWREAINDASLRGSTIRVTLHTSSYTFSSSHNVYADLTNELSTAVGYTSGGVSLTGIVWDHTGATANLDADDAIWTASGGSIVARRAVIRIVGTFNSQVDPLIASVLMDTTPANVTATDGSTLELRWNAGGIFTLT